MIGLHGKSAKPAPRASQVSKSARPASTMATSGGNGIRSRTSSSASERAETLSVAHKGPTSPYSQKLTPGPALGSGNSGRRVQSAATSRQKSALSGPTVKASEFFRKNNSEPQLVNKGNNKNNGKTGTNNVNAKQGGGGGLKTSATKNVKHVRIDTERNLSSDSFNTTLNTAANLLGIQGSKAFNQGGSHPSHQKRPFSFCSDSRNRSLSVASNDSCSTAETDLLNDELGGGDGGNTYWRKDNKSTDKNHNFSVRNTTTDYSSSISTDSQNSRVTVGAKGNPRLSKRSYSMDTGTMDSDQEDNFWDTSPPGNSRPQKIEMKIAEQPEETFKEKNVTTGRIGSASARSKLNRAFTDDISVARKPLTSARGVSEDRNMTMKNADFDRMLLKQSDNLLQGVNDLINEIKSTEPSKKLDKSTTSSLPLFVHDSIEIEKLVTDLRNDMNKQKLDSCATLSVGKKSFSPEVDQKQQFSMLVDDRLNFSTLAISGTELSDITCPVQVMEQSESVPNTGRSSIDRPLSAVVLGNSKNVSSDIISEAETYLLMNKEERLSKAQSSKNGSSDGFDTLSDSNNQTFPSSGALSIIEQQHRIYSARSPNSQRSQTGDNQTGLYHGSYDMSQEEIQQKICSALQLLEEEDKKFRSARKGSSTPRPDTSIQSQSPYLSTSNPDSRPESRGGGQSEDSCKASPRVRSEERNRLFENYNNSHTHPARHLSGGGVSSSTDFDNRNEVKLMSSEPQSARSCSCLLDHVSNESLHSARSSKTIAGTFPNNTETGRHGQMKMRRAGSREDAIWDAREDKTKQIFSFLDEVERSDQEMLFGLRFDTDSLNRAKVTSNSAGMGAGDSIMSNSITGKKGSREDKSLRSMDSLIRKGSVELAREIIMLESKLEQAHHSIKLLEENLLHQRDLNIRNLRNTEKDFKKRLKLQKEEFEQVFARNEALINEMATEKRVLQDKFDKLIKNFEEMEEKHKDHVKSMQQKHLDEIRRLRKMQQNAETSLKKNLAGNKAQAQEIREMTVKGLEPEVQRIIQRHQQEMSEMRAWHADEVREIEERYQRKLHMQLEDLRQKFAKEKEDVIARERDAANRRIHSELKQKEDEIESMKRRHTNELFEERERSILDETKLKESIQESVRKAQIKAEVEMENLKQEYETKLNNLERRHETEIKTLKDVYDAERQNWATTQMKKLEQALSEQETKLKEVFQTEKEREWRDKERKLKEEFEKCRKEDELAGENRFRRMQEKFQTELNEMERIEKDVKSKFSQSKTDLLASEEQVFSLKTSISLKDKQLTELQEINMKMQEERVNLTSVIRREFTDQIQAVEEECRCLKASIVEVQSNAKLQIEQKQLETERIIAEKDSEIEKIGLRVKQALGRKDETILELQKQLDKSSFEISHLEELLEEQRKELLHGMTKMPTSSGGGRGHKK